MKAKLLAALAILACAPALVDAMPAPIVIKDDPGGLIDAYATRYNTISAARQHVVIDGACKSACTMIFGRVPDSRVCVTPRAAFGFHSATNALTDDEGHVVWSKFSILGTRVLTWRYPHAVRAAIRRRGWDMASPHPDIIMIPAAELGVYRECQ